MNLKQRIVSFIGLLVIAGMLLFPPFVMPGTDIYRPVFSPPQYTSAIPSIDGNRIRTSSINTQRLVFQCLIVLVVTGGTILLLGAKRVRE